MSLSPLPIDDVLPELLAELRCRPAVLLRAPTGAGKTTRVPPALLDAGLAGAGEVIVLEPRRLAARSAAARCAAERREPVGATVGYQVRFDRKRGADTRLSFVTEGVFLRRLQADPLLEGVGAVVFDEFHERSLDADLALALVRRVQEELRGDLKLVVMSATLRTEGLREFLGDAPLVESLGRTHPVEVRHLEPAERPERGRPGPEDVARAVGRALGATSGDVLAFLPGVGEIRRTRQALEDRARREGLALFELYGELAPEDQDRALRHDGARAVFLATNVAETSITLPRVTAVVDSGLVRRLRHDPVRGLNRLELEQASRASARQRSGRAGRTGPGICLRLWTEHDERTRPEEQEPEVRRIDVAPALLQLLAWGEARPREFPWFEAPPSASLATGLELLERLGATRADGQGATRLTAVGETLVRLPLHPRTGRLLHEGARLGVPREAALGAALLSERSPFRREGRRQLGGAAVDSDLVDRVHALEDFEASGTRISPAGELGAGTARQVLRVARDLERATPTAAEAAPREERDERLARALLAAYPDRLARRRAPGDPRAMSVGGGGLRLAAESAVREAELFLALEVRGGGPDALVTVASEVRREWLDRERLVEEEELTFDATEERVIARRVLSFDDLVLDARPTRLERGPESAAVLAAAAGADLERALELGTEELVQLRARLACLSEWMPELGLPVLDDDRLRELLPQLCAGCLGFAELRKRSMAEALRGDLAWEELQALERHAPERLELPSGNRIRLVYEPGRPPVLAARIQELFGWTATPCVAAGRVPVLLHLLAPNYRPQQVTDDLGSFWSTTYGVVRKELRRRYPKHDWPEDPLTARARRRPR